MGKGEGKATGMDKGKGGKVVDFYHIPSIFSFMPQH